MKTLLTLSTLATTALLVSVAPATAARRSASRASSALHTLTAYGRYYGDHSAYTNRPFQKDDIGVGLSYEYREATGFWQIGLEFCSRPGTWTEGYTLTPFLNLCFQDRWLFAGLGIRKPYLLDTDDDGWSDLYYNWLLGLEVPLGSRLSVNITGIYDFYKWQELDEFKFRDVEASAGLTYRF